MQAYLKEQETLMEGMQHEVDEFGNRYYVENGEFVEQMLACCDRFDVDVKGDYPSSELTHE